MLHLKLKSESANKDLPILFTAKLKAAPVSVNSILPLSAQPIGGEHLTVEVVSGDCLLYSDSQATLVIGAKAVLTDSNFKLYVRGSTNSEIHISDTRNIATLDISALRVTDELSFDISDLKFAYNLQSFNAQFNSGVSGNVSSLAHTSIMHTLNLYGSKVIGSTEFLQKNRIVTLQIRGTQLKMELTHLSTIATLVELKGLPLNTIGDIASIPASAKQLVLADTVRKIVCTDLKCTILSYVDLPEMDDLSVKKFTEKAAQKSWTGSVCNVICQNDRGILDVAGNIVDNSLLADITTLKAKGVAYKLNGVLR